jgi:hypothetical protein
VSIGAIGRLVVGALLSVSLLYGCAGESTASLPSASVLQSLASPPAGDPQARVNLGKWIYTVQLYGEDLTIYRRHALTLTFDKTLTKGVSSPLGTKATPSGWWYVSNGGHSNVLVYRTTSRGPEGPVATLDDYGQIPSNVDAIPSRRVVAVSNYSTVGGGAGSVSIYLNRQAEPSRTLTYGSDPLQGTGVAIDHQRNCYWSFNDPTTGNGSIVKFTNCSGKGTVVVPAIASSAGLTFDQRDDLYYVDETVGIYKCRKTSDCHVLIGVSKHLGLPVSINFDQKDKLLWVADASGYIDAIDPTSGAIKYHKPANGGPTDPPFGIAPAPGG